MPDRRAPLIWTALLTVYVVWGSTYLAIRYAIGSGTDEAGLPPLTMAALRFLVAGALMFAWAARRPHPDGQPDPLGAPQWRSTAVVGIALLFGGNGLVVLAEQRIDSYIAAVLVAMVPIWAALIAVLVGRQRIPRVGVAGLVLGFVGVLVLSAPSGETQLDLVGVLMTLVATVAWSTGSYYARGAPLPRRPLVMTAMQMIWGGLALGVAALVSGDAARLDVAGAGSKAWLAFVYLVVFGSLVAFTAYAWLLRNAQLSLVTTYAYVNPLVAVVLGALLLNEQVTGRTLAASGFIVVGVALIVSVQRPRDVATEEPGPAVGPKLAPSGRSTG